MRMVCHLDSFCNTFQGTLNSQVIGRGGGPEGGIRLSLANSEGQLAATYPAMLILPSGMADDRLERVARAHRHGRLPCIVWRHPRTRALLLRAAGFSSKAGVMDALKTAQPATGKSLFVSHFVWLINLFVVLFGFI